MRIREINLNSLVLKQEKLINELKVLTQEIRDIENREKLNIYVQIM